MLVVGIEVASGKSWVCGETAAQGRWYSYGKSWIRYRLEVRESFGVDGAFGRQCRLWGNTKVETFQLGRRVRPENSRQERTRTML